MKLLATMLMTVLMSVSAYAADVDGTWTGTAAAPAGDVAVDVQIQGGRRKIDGIDRGS